MSDLKTSQLLLLALACACTEAPPGRAACTASQGQALTRAASDPSVALTSKERASFGALVTADGETICSGVLIAEGWVLTARHCPPLGKDQPLSFRSSLEGVPVTIAAALRFEHPERDLALLELSSNPLKAPDVQTLKLWDSSDGLPQLGDVLTLVGFGTTEAGQSGSLGFLEEPVVAVDAQSIVVDGGDEHGACGGDSGGPLLAVAPDGSLRIIGILSTGDKRCVGQDHYLRVDDLKPWLDEVWADRAASPCADLDWEGVCAQGRATWCVDGRVEAEDCINHQLCGWDLGALGYRCVAEDKDPCQGAGPTGLCDDDILRRCDRGRRLETDCAACGLRCQWNNEGAACL